MSSHSLLQEIFLTQGSNPGLLHCRHIVYYLSQEGRCYICKIGGYICKIKNLLIASEECETKICSSLHSCQYRPGQCDPGSHTGVTFLRHHESHPYKWRNWDVMHVMKSSVFLQVSNRFELVAETSPCLSTHSELLLLALLHLGWLSWGEELIPNWLVVLCSCCSGAQLCPTPYNLMNCNMPGFMIKCT